MYRSVIGLKERIHFIGIGGIGMSGLAQVMSTMGFKVQGSDISTSKNIERCRKVGIKIFGNESIISSLVNTYPHIGEKQWLGLLEANIVPAKALR